MTQTQKPAKLIGMFFRIYSDDRETLKGRAKRSNLSLSNFMRSTLSIRKIDEPGRPKDGKNKKPAAKKSKKVAAKKPAAVKKVAAVKKSAKLPKVPKAPKAVKAPKAAKVVDARKSANGKAGAAIRRPRGMKVPVTVVPAVVVAHSGD